MRVCLWGRHHTAPRSTLVLGCEGRNERGRLFVSLVGWLVGWLAWSLKNDLVGWCDQVHLLQAVEDRHGDDVYVAVRVK